MRKDPKWVMPRNTTPFDPRIAIARHIGWSKSLSTVTDYSLPEPDHFNYAVFNKQPIECPSIHCQVFYQDQRQQGWWSVYFVPAELEDNFIAWAHPIDFEICWAPMRPTKMRERRTLLSTKRQDSDMTLPELLYTNGYYSELQTTFNIDISQQLGTPRSKIPIPEQQEEVDFD